MCAIGTSQESADEGTMEDLEIPEIKDAVSFIEGK